MRADGFGDFLVGTDRRAQDDEIGAFHGIDGIGIGFRDEAKSLGPVASLGRRRATDDFADEAAAPRRVAYR